MTTTEQAAQMPRTVESCVRLLEQHSLLECAPAADELAPSFVLRGVCCDSRRAMRDSLFICKGAHFKADYARDALAAGAAAYLASERIEGVAAPCILVNDVRAAMGILADAFFEHPSGDLKICAITGTKGKTTSAYYLKSIVDEHARSCEAARCALLSTIAIDDGIERVPSTLTTPEPIDLQQHLANARKAGASAVVMEASSQALKYGRLACVALETGMFTNLGEDHISPIEHPDFADYMASKLSLFDRCRNAVVNADDPHGQAFVDAAHAAGCERVITYSMHDPAADFYADNIRRVQGGVSFDAHFDGACHPLLLNTMGAFNIANALGAMACAVTIGIGPDDIARGLARAVVPGRMETFAHPQRDIVGVIDYAHNGSSLEALLADVRESYPDRRVIAVFGATGTKGVERRFGMGEAAGRLADVVITTEDDPGQERVEDICDAIASSARAAGATDVRIVLDREQAVREAIAAAVEPAVIVLAGKGHERTIIRKEGRVPYEGDASLITRLFNE